MKVGNLNVTNKLVLAGQEITGSGSGGGSASLVDIEQNSHGFSVGDLLYLNSTTYTKAIATSEAASEVIGIVSEVVDGNNFKMTLPGSKITGLSDLTAGTTYFLSDSTAGAMTSTEPTTLGYISKPVLIADSATSGYFLNYRGIEIFN